MKTSGEHPICAAIGDGANDVSMIQEAHVGLGGMRLKECFNLESMTEYLPFSSSIVILAICGCLML